MDRKKKISVLIPFYNEEEVLPQLFTRLAAVMDSMGQYDWEVMLVNDGSSDRSLLAAARIQQADPRFHYIDLSRNFGKEIAMMAGFDYVTGDCTVIMDSDLQHPPEVIPEMIAAWEEGYDDIYGQRLTRGKEPWLRKTLSLAYYRLLQKSTKIPVLENTGDFRLLDRMCIDALKSMRESNRYTKGMYCYVGFKKKGVPFKQEDRAAGTTKWNFFKLFNLAIEGITSYTSAPLRIATAVGTVISALALLYLVYVIIKVVAVGEPVAGYPTIIVSILFLGGLQLLFLGILGEYIGRIFTETKQRPVYFVREFDGKRVVKDNE
ncbi:MAG: glycosyltransferase family 2 protein [Pseudoflavonifractor sp.]|nr:glycosyltransferase family 2 protein [Pseudoflavonifractor sp.]